MEMLQLVKLLHSRFMISLICYLLDKPRLKYLLYYVEAPLEDGLVEQPQLILQVVIAA